MFLSYVREDAEAVDELQEALEAGGIKVWRDRDSIGFGDDWEAEIKSAITSNSLAFLACFSEASVTKEKSGQRPELILATDELRLRSPEKKWFFAVRFGEVDLPHYSIGAGRSLTTYQYEDLFGPKKLAAITRVVVAIRELFADAGGPAPPPAPVAGHGATLQLKRDLLEPSRRADAAAYVTRTVRTTRAAVTDETTFPFKGPDDTDTIGRLREFIRQEREYRAAVRPMLECIAAGCEWGGPEHLGLWTRAINALSKDRDEPPPGAVHYGGPLAYFTRLPATLALVAGSVAAVYAEKFDALRAVTLDATILLPRSGWGTEERVSALSALGIWEFLPDRETATVLWVALRDEPEELADDLLRQIASGRGRRRPPTPGSDYLALALRPIFSDLEDDEFDDAFNTAEVLLALIVADAKVETGKWVRDPWIGRFARLHYELGGESVYQRVIARARAEGAGWAPLSAGLFGNSLDRVEAAIAQLGTEMEAWERDHMPYGY